MHQPRRRALPPPARQEGADSLDKQGDTHYRRQLCGDGLRYRLPQGDPGPRRPRLRDRPAPQPARPRDHRRQGPPEREGADSGGRGPLRRQEEDSRNARGGRKPHQGRGIHLAGRLFRAHRRRDRAQTVGPVVPEDGRTGRQGARERGVRKDTSDSRQVPQHLPPLDGERPRLVHLTPALVGAAHTRILSARRQRGCGGDSRARPRGSKKEGPLADHGGPPPGRGRARHLVLELALADFGVRPGKARTSRPQAQPRPFILLSHQRPGHRPGHHFLLGGEDDNGRR